MQHAPQSSPPGTPPAPPPPEFGGTIPRIHPDGPDFLGVRVPALIVTPWVSAGSVCNTVFDHTSIIKTILVCHRDRVPEEWFTMFGVNLANHVGAAFDLASPRTDLPRPISSHFAARRPGDPPPEVPAWDGETRQRPTYPEDGDQQDFRAALCRAMVPFPRPTR